MRPPSILRFEKAYLASIAISVLNTIIFWSTATAALDDPAVEALGVGQGALAAVLVISTIISLLLWYFIARRASKVAKWIFVLFLAFGVVSLLSSLANPQMPRGMELVLNLFATALQVYAAWQLFKPDAKAWLASGGKEGAVDPAVFD
jgi:uncharacterized membrane protein YtjA (UPF0391 family)